MKKLKNILAIFLFDDRIEQRKTVFRGTASQFKQRSGEEFFTGHKLPAFRSAVISL